VPGVQTTILLVEDNPDDAELVRIAMDDAGITSTLDVVQDGAQALQYVRNEGPFTASPRPDLVLLDLNLPGVDGREVLRTVKSDPELCSIPIVVMSTSVDDNDIDASYRMHANSFVSKPPDFDQLVSTLAAIQAFWLTAARLPRR
jgi:two-component system, chemotaxis family, response regulator Rcp1